MEILDIMVGEPPEPAIVKILKHIRPAWSRDTLVIKELKGGVCNCLYYCGLTTDTEESDVVIVKVYGQIGEDLSLDRDKEVFDIGVAHSAGLASPVYCRFKNGLVYKYYRGHIVTSHSVNDEVLARGMAKILADVHLVDYNKAITDSGRNKDNAQVAFTLRLIEMSKQWITSINDSYDDPWKQKIFVEEFPSKHQAFEAIEGYRNELMELDFSTCYCHSDPNPTNTIYDTRTGEIRLIDWETCGIDFAAHDIGFYFASKVMVDDCAEESLKFYPNKESQLKWIRWYLEYTADRRGKGRETVTEADINKIYKGSILCAMMRVLGAVNFFRVQDAMSSANIESFRKARHFQRLYEMIKSRHYQS